MSEDQQPQIDKDKLTRKEQRIQEFKMTNAIYFVGGLILGVLITMTIYQLAFQSNIEQDNLQITTNQENAINIYLTWHTNYDVADLTNAYTTIYPACYKLGNYSTSTHIVANAQVTDFFQFEKTSECNGKITILVNTKKNVLTVVQKV